MTAPEPPRRPRLDQMTDNDLDALHSELEGAKEFARSCARDTEKALKREKRAKLRADLLQCDVDTLRGGLREIGADPTQIQNLWAQIRLRNGQWREEKQRAERAEAALERARAECDRIETVVYVTPQGPTFDGAYLAALRRIRAALDEPTQPKDQP